MQSTPSWPDGPSVTPAGAVTHLGVERLAESVQIDRALPWSPDGSDSGITAATGTVVWAGEAESTSRAPNPWSGGSWPPKPQDAVTIDGGLDGQSVRLLTGIVEDTGGAFSQRAASSKVVDHIDRLNRSITIDPMLATMPGPRRIGLSLPYLVDRELRACGFYATPPQWSGSVASIPLQGSAEGERGFASSASAASSATALPTFAPAPWGLAATNLNAVYTPAFTAGTPGILDRNMQMVLMVDGAAATSGSSYIMARWGTSYVLLTTFKGAGATFVQGRVLVGGATTTAVQMEAGSAHTFSLLVTPAGDFTLYADDGRTDVGSAALDPAMGTNPMDQVEVRVNTGAAPLAGAQVMFSTAIVTEQWTPTAVMTYDNGGTLQASPAIVDRQVLGLIREQADAVRAATWIDEHGVFRWVDRGALVGAAPVTTLTALDDLLDVAWSSSLTAARSEAVVAYRSPTIRFASRDSITLWSGSGETLESGEVVEQVIGPDADTEWVNVDAGSGGTLLSIYNSGGGTALNMGVRSLTGGVRVEDGTPDASGSASDVSTELVQIDPRRWVLTSTAGSLPSGKDLTMRAPETGSISESQRGLDLPVVRGQAMYTRVDRTVTGSTTGNPDAPALEHDAGPWVQSSGVAQSLANWISARVTTPMPVIERLDIVPDPRLQLGDVVTVEDQVRTGVRLTCLVVGISLGATVGRLTQTLSVYVLDSEVPWPTLDEVDAAWAGSTLDEVDAAQTGSTLNQFDNNPLEGS